MPHYSGMPDRNDKKQPHKSTPRPPKPRQKLNIRERKFIKGIVSGLSATEAMRQAGYAETTARIKQGAKLAQVSESIQAICERLGLSDEAIVSTLASGLVAQKCISAIGEADGKSTDFVEVPDWSNRLKAADMALKVKGKYPSEKLDVKHTGSVTLVID